MRNIFITGTDTGVGKTLVTAGLVGAISKRGIKVGVMKPVQSGGIMVRNELISEDARLLLDASGLDLPMEVVNPYCFEPAISPDLAAGKTIVSLDLIKHNLMELSSLADCVFVEGAGGIASPLIKNKTNGEVARELGLPVIIISPQRLGTINNSVLTIEYLKNRGMEVIGVILNNPGEPSPGAEEEMIRRTNGEQIHQYGKVRILGEMPHMTAPMDACGSSELSELIERTSENIDIDHILERMR